MTTTTVTTTAPAPPPLRLPAYNVEIESPHSAAGSPAEGPGALPEPAGKAQRQP